MLASSDVANVKAYLIDSHAEPSVYDSEVVMNLSVSDYSETYNDENTRNMRKLSVNY